jgi:Multiubiquitin
MVHFVTAVYTPVEIEIIVNTRGRTVQNATVSFEQIVELAFTGPHEANVVFSMTYRKAASVPHAGELGAHGPVTVKKGTIFNVTRTVQS